MAYYDLAVQEKAFEEKKFLKIAGFMGWHGIGKAVIVKSFEQAKELEKNFHSFVEEQNNLKIFSCAVLKLNSAGELKKCIKTLRERVLLLAVYGGEYELNRTACCDSRVDFLLHPYLERKDCGVDEYCLKKAKENEIAIGITLHYILNVHRKHRIALLQNIAELLRLCHELHVSVIACSFASSYFELRDPRAIASLLNVLGYELGKAIEAVSAIPEFIIEKNLKILSGKAPVRGVEVISDEE